LESVPLRLMIICVVAALSVVPAAEGLQEMKSRDFLRRATLELERTISAAEVVGVEGPGSVRTVALDFTGGVSQRFLSLSVGDRQGGPNESTIIMKLTSGATVLKSASEPPACLRSSAGESLVITDPEPTIRLSCQLENCSWFVLVEVE